MRPQTKHSALNFYWSAISESDGYGFAIIHTARWCHHREGELCKSPFPKGEKCSIENCVMRPQEMKEICPEEFQVLMDERDALRAKLAAAEERATKAEAEADALADSYDMLKSAYSSDVARLTAAEERCEDLRRLSEFAGHTNICAAYMEEGESPCRCGYEAALAATQER